MMEIAVLIPTYGRTSRLDALVANFKRNSRVSNLYFIVEKTDQDTISWLKNSKQTGFIVSGEYVTAINYGYKHTSEPFIFCGSDDITFSKDWDRKLLKHFEDTNIHVTGGTDDWLCSQAGIHISHPLIRREYIETLGSSFGLKDVLYYPDYQHYWCDIELEQLAWTRGCIKVDQDVVIAHNHFVNNKVKTDATYQRSYVKLRADTKLYEERKKNFEYWSTEGLHQGIRKISEFRKKKLSIVMPTWNCKEYIEKTVNSLIEKTLHKYEVIIIDDCSTEFGMDYLRTLEKRLKEHFVNVTLIRNKEQMYCNHNWSKGVGLATGDYIAIINSDIEFEVDEWDDYLIEDLDMGYQLVNPYQNDRIYGHPYMKPPHEDFLFKLNIRGACYMVSKDFAKKVFPIPKQLKHWFGDNFISQQARDFMYDIRVSIYHHISKSGAKVNQKLFWSMVNQDLAEYQKLYPKDDLSPIERNIKKNVEYHSKNT